MTLPKGFALWDLADNNGVTVREAADNPDSFFEDEDIR
jgi:hypothetical protein